MNHLFTFRQLFEKLQMVTSNWSIVSNESSFEKKDENGYLVFSKDGTFSIIYKKKGVQEESRIEFYSDKEYSTDKKSICECKITTTSGSDRVRKGFTDINDKNVWEIISVFFDYSDIEKSPKNSADVFLMGFSKSIKEVNKSEEKDQLSPSFLVFYKYLMDWSKKSDNIPPVKTDEYNFIDLVNKFLSYFRSKKIN
jgi:hypothetical protein